MPAILIPDDEVLADLHRLTSLTWTVRHATDESSFPRMFAVRVGRLELCVAESAMSGWYGYGAAWNAPLVQTAAGARPADEINPEPDGPPLLRRRPVKLGFCEPHATHEEALKALLADTHAQIVAQRSSAQRALDRWTASTDDLLKVRPVGEG